MWTPTHVQVTVQQARSLISKGKNDTNDAYVTISSGKEKYQTTIKERSKDPVWHEECDLHIPDLSAVVQLNCYHRNLLGIDEFLGHTEIPLDQFPVYERPRNRWYVLKNKPGSKKAEKYRGEIEVKITFLVQSLSGSHAGLDKSGKVKKSASFKTIASAMGGKLNVKWPSKGSLTLNRTGSDERRSYTEGGTYQHDFLPTSYNNYDDVDNSSSALGSGDSSSYNEREVIASPDHPSTPSRTAPRQHKKRRLNRISLLSQSSLAVPDQTLSLDDVSKNYRSADSANITSPQATERQTLLRSYRERAIDVADDPATPPISSIQGNKLESEVKRTSSTTESNSSETVVEKSRIKRESQARKSDYDATPQNSSFSVSKREGVKNVEASVSVSLESSREVKRVSVMSSKKESVSSASSGTSSTRQNANSMTSASESGRATPQNDESSQVNPGGGFKSCESMSSAVEDDVKCDSGSSSDKEDTKGSGSRSSNERGSVKSSTSSNGRDSFKASESSSSTSRESIKGHESVSSNERDAVRSSTSLSSYRYERECIKTSDSVSSNGMTNTKRGMDVKEGVTSPCSHRSSVATEEYDSVFEGSAPSTPVTTDNTRPAASDSDEDDDLHTELSDKCKLSEQHTAINASNEDSLDSHKTRGQESLALSTPAVKNNHNAMLTNQNHSAKKSYASSIASTTSSSESSVSSKPSTHASHSTVDDEEEKFISEKVKKMKDPSGRHTLQYGSSAPRRSAHELYESIYEYKKAKEQKAMLERENSIPDEIINSFEHHSREDLIKVILEQQNQLRSKDMCIKDLENYIDNLLVRVIETTPGVLQNPPSPEKSRVIKIPPSTRTSQNGSSTGNQAAPANKSSPITHTNVRFTNSNNSNNSEVSIFSAGIKKAQINNPFKKLQAALQ